MRLVFVAALDMVTSGSFDALPKAAGSFDVKGAAHRLDRLALDLERSSGYSSLSNDPEATMPSSRNLTVAPVAALRRCPCFLTLPLMTAAVPRVLVSQWSSPGDNLIPDSAHSTA
jgi:hypothetical protein